MPDMDTTTIVAIIAGAVALIAILLLVIKSGSAKRKIKKEYNALVTEHVCKINDMNMKDYTKRKRRPDGTCPKCGSANSAYLHNMNPQKTFTCKRCGILFGFDQKNYPAEILKNEDYFVYINPHNYQSASEAKSADLAMFKQRVYGKK